MRHQRSLRAKNIRGYYLLVEFSVNRAVGRDWCPRDGGLGMKISHEIMSIMYGHRQRCCDEHVESSRPNATNTDYFFLLAAHSSNSVIAFRSFIPSSVSMYSTRGGIWGNDSRLTSPSSCSLLGCLRGSWGLLYQYSYL